MPRNDHGNVDLYARDPRAQRREPLDLGGEGQVGYGKAEGNALVFDFIRRVSYQPPPTTGVSFNLFTVTQTVTRGVLTDIGIGSPQFDWFGTNQYYIAINDAAPYNQLYDISGGPGPAGSFFGFLPVGSLQQPRATRIPVKTSETVQLKIAPQTTPLIGTVIYNLFVRIAGVLYR